jgi:hypothetical protein
VRRQMLSSTVGGDINWTMCHFLNLGNSKDFTLHSLNFFKTTVILTWNLLRNPFPYKKIVDRYLWFAQPTFFSSLCQSNWLCKEGQYSTYSLKSKKRANKNTKICHMNLYVRFLGYNLKISDIYMIYI